MTPASALELLYRQAAGYNGGTHQSAARTYRAILQKALQGQEGSEADAQQLQTMKTELLDATLRIAELEEQLAEAKKPRRRSTRKKSDTATAKPVEGSTS